MSDLWLEAFNAISDEDFVEVPVTIEEFVTSEEFLHLPPLSDNQYTMIRAGSQIYKYDTLVSLYGERAAADRWRETCQEVILQLGKGSGKDYTSTIACCYIVYLLLCLKDPAAYYGKPRNDAIDIINVAINADQAKNVFFKGFKEKIKSCPWFEDKFTETSSPPSIAFDKNVTVYSGHSEREAFEGLNLLVAILDEISGFALESTTGHAQAKTADATYRMYRDSVDSRFPDFGKVLLLSFPRFEGDYIQQRYNAAVAEKEVVMRSHTFKLDPDLPDGIEGNEFVVEWEEDHIIRYSYPGLFALRRPTWEVNPTRKIDDFTRAFHENPGNALGKYACMPSNLEDGFFKNKEAIDTSFVLTNGVDEHGMFLETFRPKKERKYFIHVDLAQKHDHCAVALAYVDKWVEVSVGGTYKEIHPVVVVPAIRWWTPTADKSVDFGDVRDYIMALRRRGFDIGLVTFDRWNSNDMINFLNRNGMKSELLSVAKKHYDDFLSVLYDQRLLGANVQLLKDELGQLRLIKDKVDHPRKGSKDLSDAVCGAIFNAVAHTPRRRDNVVEVHTYADLAKQQREDEAEKLRQSQNVIRAPKADMPNELTDYLSRAKVL